MKLHLLSLVLFFVSSAVVAASECGYQGCPAVKEGFINVHLVPHTHDDVGWLKTVDQYYYGGRNNIQQAGVQYIIDSVVDELKANPDRRFIYVEMAFFYQWWQEQTDEIKNDVKQLVNEGRLEFINGGWCMNDEATTHYADIIDQMSLGLNILNETFGECGRPRISWQIDPFGHSREQAFLFAQMGYDGLFFGRLDHEDKAQRMAAKTMEMIWSTSSSLSGSGSDVTLFTGVNYNLYQPPPGFCFDIFCSDEPIIDDPESKDYNVDQRVDEFLDYCQRQSDVYGTGNIMLTMGSDFHYQDAHVWFKNMDKLIKYANERQTSGSLFNLIYSTPSCYVKALNDLNRSWSSKTDDFFPYGSDAHSYWTGYFTSRPALKYMVREAGSLLQSCKQAASVLDRKGAAMEGDISTLKEAMGIMQHHDAVAGTEKQHVANDYARLVHLGVVECQKTMTSYYENELKLAGISLPEISYCQLNISQCNATENNDKFVVNVYNSLARNVDKYIRVPVISSGYNYQVLDPAGEAVEAQLVPISTFVQSLPGRESMADSELVFLAAQLPPLGSKSYHVERTTKRSRISAVKSKSKLKAVGRRGWRADSIISSDKLTVTVDGTTGLLKSIKGLDGVEKLVKQEFRWYEGFNGNNYEAKNRSSGAYIFRPVGDSNANAIYNENSPAFVTAVHTGPLVQEIHQQYDTWVNQIIRIYNGQEHVEFDWVVGPIPVLDRVGKEIINRITVEGVANNGVFYTDANGRQSVRRQVDTRESYPYTITEQVAANYYPLNSHLYIRKETTNGDQATLLVDRSQGGSSLKNGWMEAMVHRRLLHDDAFGVGEALDETAYGPVHGLVVRGTHYLVLGSVQDSASKFRPLAQQIYRQPLVSFIPTTFSFKDWSTIYKTQQQSISRTLPENVNLLTLESRNDGSYLIRLEHIYEAGEDAILSQPVTVSLDGLFPGFTVDSAEETMLGGNQYKSDSSRLSWKAALSNEMEKGKSNHYVKPALAVPAVQLNPMEIRTFILRLSKI